MISKNIYVSGIVQGVGFRWFVQKTAHDYLITGWTKNLDDGRVEIFASGKESHMEDFIKEINRGNKFSKVESIEVIDIEYTEFTAFKIKY